MCFQKSNSRLFRLDWLSKYSWLRYSPSKKGGFCLCCSLFFHKAPFCLQKKTVNLVSEPVVATNHSTTIFNKHERSLDGIHKFCDEAMTTFLKVFLQKELPISVMVNNMNKQKKKENTSVLVPIIDSIILCGRLGIPLRGHRDDSFSYPNAGEYASTAGVGNFIEIINFAIRRGDKCLEDHYRNHKKNASYLSKTTQNDLIESCGSLIVSEIVSEIKSNKFFTIIADEAMDASGKEQLSLTFRYIDSNFEIKEDFIGFFHLKDGLTGEALANTISLKIDELGLSLDDCRGQGYDGAGSVAGHKNGCSAHILRRNRKALYTHCFSHRLNLAVSKACKITSVDNMMASIQGISDFFRLSEQRQLAFQKFVLQYAPDSSRRKLQDVCRTRWVERIKDLGLFIELFAPLWHTLDDMRLNLSGCYNRKTSQDAFSFFKSIDTFDFIVNLIMTFHVFDLTLLVTQLLQSKKNDIADGIHMIESLISLVSSIRNDVDTYHDKWYQEALELANKVSITESKPRTTSRQLHRANHPSSSISDFYKFSITIPLLNYLLDLSSRFSQNSLVSYSGLYLVPSKVVSLSKEGKSLKDLLRPFLEFYEDHFPFFHLMENEIDLWERYWLTNNDSCPNNISNTLKSIKFDGFHNIKVALRILGTLPITSCECERSFSAM